MNEQEFRDLSAGYALDALDAGDVARFERARAEHPEWEPIVAADRDAAAFLAEDIAPVAPPADLKARLLDQIGASPAPVDSAPPASAEDGALAPESLSANASEDDPAHTPDPESGTSSAEPVAADGEDDAPANADRGWGGRRGMYALAASVAFLLVMGLGTLLLVDWLTPPSAATVLAEIDESSDAKSTATELEPGSDATLHWSEDADEAVIVVSGMAAPEAGSVYEIWYVRESGPVSAGTFTTKQGDAAVVLPDSLEPGDSIAVTVEQEGGSPTGAPTTDPLFVLSTDTL